MDLVVPPRVTVGNLDTNEFLMAQFNPSKFKMSIDVVWNKLAVQGHSHQPQQYVHTGNMALSFDFGFDAASSGEQYDVRHAERFLQALCYPVRAGTSVANSAPPQVLIGWPNMYNVTANLHKLEINYNLFDSTMSPTLFIASITVEQALITKLYSDDVARMGPTWVV